jgi:hypothetical protein
MNCSMGLLRDESRQADTHCVQSSATEQIRDFARDSEVTTITD